MCCVIVEVRKRQALPTGQRSGEDACVPGPRASTRRSRSVEVLQRCKKRGRTEDSAVLRRRTMVMKVYSRTGLSLAGRSAVGRNVHSVGRWGSWSQGRGRAEFRMSFWRRDTAPWVLPGSSTGSRHSWRSVKRKADARRSSPCHQRCVCRNRMAVSVSVIVSMRRRKCSTPRSGTCSNGGYTTPAEKRDGEGHFRRRNLVKVMCLLCCLI